MYKLQSAESKDPMICKDRVEFFNRTTGRFWDYLYLSRHCGLDRGEDVIIFLRENETAYFAPIVAWRDALLHYPVEVSKEYKMYMFDQYEIIQGVYYETLVHSMRVLTDRCAKLLSIKYKDICYNDGFGSYNEKNPNQCKGLLDYAHKHINDEYFFKWITEKYNEWIKNVIQFDNGTKHNFSSDPLCGGKIKDEGNDIFTLETIQGRRWAYNKSHKRIAEIVNDEMEDLVYNTYDFFDSVIKHIIC